MLMLVGLAGAQTPNSNLTQLGGPNKQVKGTLGIVNGGCGQTTATACMNALLPSQTGNNGKVLGTDGTNFSWVAQTGGGGGGMVYPAGGIAVSSGTGSWLASLAAPASAIVGLTDVQVLTHKDLTDATNTFRILNQNTSGTAANLSGTPALPNGTTVTTQTPGDNTTKAASDAFVLANAGGGLAGLTANAVPKSTSSTTLGNSACSDSGTLFNCTDSGGVQANSFAAVGTGTPDTWTQISTPIAPVVANQGYQWFDGTTNHVRDMSFSGGVGHIGTSVEAYPGATHQFLTMLSTAGIFTSVQPVVADVSGAAPIDSPVFTTQVTLPFTSFSTRGTVTTGPPPATTNPALNFVSDPNYGLSVGLNGNETWPLVGVQVTSTTAIFSLTTPINTISWLTADCFQVQSLPGTSNLSAFNGQDMAVTSRNGSTPTSTITVTLAGTANSCQTGAVTGTLPSVGTYTGLTATAEHYAAFLAGHTWVYNRLISSSQFCPNIGSIRLCDSSNSNSDKLYGYDPNTSTPLLMLSRWTGSGPTVWTQLGDTNGSITPGGLSTPALLDTAGNKEIAFTTAASAVDYLTFANSAAGTPGVLTLTATGTDTNISINLVAKGSGTVQCNGSTCSGGGGSMVYPGAGIPLSVSGTSWGTSFGLDGSGPNVVLNTSPTIVNSATGTQPVIVNAIIGTTADLQDWQVNSATKAYLDNNGTMHATTGYEGIAASSNTAYMCGQDGQSVTGCQGSFRGADHTANSGSESAGTATFRGGNNVGNVNNVGVLAGDAILQGGMLSNASPGALAGEGKTVINESFKGAGTIGTLACYNGTFQTIVSCSSVANNTAWVGVIQATTGGSQAVTTFGDVAGTFDATITAVPGDLVCTSTTTAGDLSDVSVLSPALTSCPTSQAYVGRVKNQLTAATTTAIVNLDGRNRTYGASLDLGTISYVSAGTTGFPAAGAGMASGAVVATHSTSTTFTPTGMTNRGKYELEISQDSTGGGVTFTLAGCTWKISGGGAGAITLSTGANAHDWLTWRYDGTNCWGTLSTNYN